MVSYNLDAACIPPVQIDIIGEEIFPGKLAAVYLIDHVSELLESFLFLKGQ